MHHPRMAKSLLALPLSPAQISTRNHQLPKLVIILPQLSRTPTPAIQISNPDSPKLCMMVTSLVIAKIPPATSLFSSVPGCSLYPPAIEKEVQFYKSRINKAKVGLTKTTLTPSNKESPPQMTSTYPITNTASGGDAAPSSSATTPYSQND